MNAFRDHIYMRVGVMAGEGPQWQACHDRLVMITKAHPSDRRRLPVEISVKG